MNDYKYDLIWIDKGIVINEATFKTMKSLQPQAKLVGYSPDYMCARHNQSKQFIDSLKYYDVYVTTKSYAVEQLKSMGCRDVFFVGNAYQKGFHKPYPLSENEQECYGCDVGFVGSWERQRANSILYLAQHGINVMLWGDYRWELVCKLDNHLLFGGNVLKNEDYCKAICGSKISLCFLRKMNMDLQTTRTMEIPACGVFMLAERTTEHLALFEEGREAEFFDSDEELLRKVRYYLNHDQERKAIADGGLKRCESSDYSNEGRISEILCYLWNK